MKKKGEKVTHTHVEHACESAHAHMRTRGDRDAKEVEHGLEQPTSAPTLRAAHEQHIRRWRSGRRATAAAQRREVLVTRHDDVHQALFDWEYMLIGSVAGLCLCACHRGLHIWAKKD